VPGELTGTSGDGRRLLAVVAHPDDETFGCGSLLLHAAASGATTGVVCATRGEAGEPAPGSGISRAELPGVRERELREAARLLGVSSVELLDYRDSGMDGDAEAATLVGAPLDAVTEQVAACIERFRPDVVVTLDASDGHRDHARIRDATLAAVQRQPAVARVYLHCLPQSLMRRWLEHVARENPSSGHLAIDVPGTPEEQITTLVDSTDLLAQRERAMAAHASQTSPYEGLPDDLRRAFLTAERLRRVVPGWTGGQRESDVFGR
jgi:LmbE family N-acetylglucosaminyl deacetylase